MNAAGDDIAQGDRQHHHHRDDAYSFDVARRSDDQQDTEEADQNRSGPTPADAFIEKYGRQTRGHQGRRLGDRRELGDRHDDQSGDEEQRGGGIEQGPERHAAGKHVRQLRRSAAPDDGNHDQQAGEQAANEYQGADRKLAAEQFYERVIGGECRHCHGHVEAAPDGILFGKHGKEVAVSRR